MSSNQKKPQNKMPRKTGNRSLRLRGAGFKGESIRSFLVDTLFYLAGTSLYALAVMMFAVPNQISQSGVTGISIIINHLFHSPVGITNLLLNLPLMLLAWWRIGWRFVAKTAWVTLLLSIILDTFGAFVPAYRGDRLLAALYCGVISGVGLGIVLYRGATTGGMDIVAKLVRKKWPHITLGRVILVADATVVIASALVFRSFESALYAVIVIYISTRLIDSILFSSGGGKLLLVVTQQAQEIAQAIMEQLSRGVTILPVQGGYTKNDKTMLLCAVRNNEVRKLTHLVWEYDNAPFIIVAEAGEILGEGFRIPGSQE